MNRIEAIPVMLKVQIKNQVGYVKNSVNHFLLKIMKIRQDKNQKNR